MATVRQELTTRLVRTIAMQRYPSPQVLDRLEESLRTLEDVEAYAWMLQRLLDEHERHPSRPLLDRLNQCALSLELADLQNRMAEKEAA